MNPKVSIVIPIFNGANFMRQAINSALQQTYQNTEIIVINDGSTDGGASEKIALSFGDKINYIPLPQNRGGGAALNTAIRKMTGDYFSWLSHDDLYMPNKIEAQIEVLRRVGNPNALVYSNWINIDGQGKELGRHAVPSFPPGTMLPYLYLYRNIHGCSFLIPREAFHKVGMFNEHLRTTADYDLWLRMIQHYHFFACDQFLVKGRSHRDQYTFKSPNHHEETEAWYLTYMPLITREIMARSVPKENWPTYVLQLTAGLSSRAFNKAIIKWLRQLYSIIDGESAHFQEQVLASFLLGAIANLPPNSGEYVLRLVNMSKTK